MTRKWEPWQWESVVPKVISQEQWRTSRSPGQMMDHLHATGVVETRSGIRRLRLFDIACSRRGWSRLERDRVAVVLESAERDVEGTIKTELFEQICRAVRAEVEESLPETICLKESYMPHWIKHHARRQIDSLRFGVLALAYLDESGAGEEYLMTAHGVAGNGFTRELSAQCAILRDIFGDPFRPVRFSPAWRTDTAVLLAKQMYESRDFGAMPILADALQDADCNDAAILSHCRNRKQKHVRGCWVVDAVLGKK